MVAVLRICPRICPLVLRDRLRLTFWRLLSVMSLALPLVLTACEWAAAVKPPGWFQVLIGPRGPLSGLLLWQRPHLRLERCERALHVPQIGVRVRLVT